MPTYGTFGKTLATAPKVGRSYGTTTNQAASPCRRNHRRIWPHQRWRQGHGLPVGGERQLCAARLIAGLATARADSLRPCCGQPGSKAAGVSGHILPDYLSRIGVPYHIEERDTYSIVKRLIPEGQTTCSLCSRLRRGILYRVATELGATKIALGHHRDDIIETLFLNLFYTGKLKTMPPKLRSKDGRHVVIRPLSAVRENDLARYAELRAFPIIPCDLCGSQEDLKRKHVKMFLREWEHRSPGCTDSMFAALSNVAPPLLLDRRLFDFEGLKASAQPGGHEDAWLDHESHT